jgi:hypothetical protein
MAIKLSPILINDDYQEKIQYNRYHVHTIAFYFVGSFLEGCGFLLLLLLLSKILFTHK